MLRVLISRDPQGGLQIVEMARSRYKEFCFFFDKKLKESLQIKHASLFGIVIVCSIRAAVLLHDVHYILLQLVKCMFYFGKLLRFITLNACCKLISPF